MSVLKIRKLILAGLFASLVFTATWISVPAPMGNINLGDSMLLLGAWILGGAWSVIGCAVGASLCDLLSAYIIYAPATLVIKIVMGIVAILFFRYSSKSPSLLKRIVSALAAEAVMILGYFVYESFLYGIPAAVLNILFNLTQGSISIVIALLLYQILSHAQLIKFVQNNIKDK